MSGHGSSSATKVRFAVYVPFIDHRPTGVGVYVFEVLTRLLARHPDLVVYTSDPENRPEWLRGARLRPCLHSGFRATSGARGRISRLLWLATEARRAMAADAVEVLLSLVQEGSPSSRLKQVIVMHDLTALRFPDAYSKPHVWFTRHYLPRCLRAARSVICVSESTRRDVHDFAGVPVSSMSVVYEGFERATFHPPQRDDITAVRSLYGLPRHYFFYSGTFSRHKNLHLALRAFSQVWKQHPDVRFVLCGRSDSGDFTRFMEEARRLDVDHAIQMLGYVPREHLHVLLGEAEGYVFPSLFEGFGLAPLEALASGAVVISSNAGSLPEVVGQGGVLLPPTDEAAWSRTMAEIIDEAKRGDRHDALRRRAVAQASRFSWDTAVDQILELVHSA